MTHRAIGDRLAVMTDVGVQQGPLVLVTGSSRGIGLGIAGYLVSAGSRVIIHGRDQRRVDEARGQVPSGGTAGLIVGSVIADLTDPGQVEELSRQVRQRWGVPEGVVLNVGGSSIPPGPVEDLSPEDWARALDDNLTSAFLTLRTFLPAMEERGSGAFVAVSSSVTRRPHARSPVAYAAAKAGLEALVRSVAVQAGPAGIRANCVVPDIIMTERNERAIPEGIRPDLIAAHPLQRLGTVEDVAAAVAFLLSPAAAWITGESLGITGGA